ncbi:MAG: Hsp20/alpha crystallin family protein [Candidatus Levybacteria bacterium]|nr:Hsp20/alpha crystallin family protein [Candidatus Levybacteria bacterium]
MANDLMRTNFWRIPIITSDLWEDLSDLVPMSGTLNGLSVSEDDKNVYVEAAVPGVDPKNVDVTFDKGVLWVKGAAEEEKKGKKYYRKASSSFSYRVAIPGEVDWKTEPVATYKNGVMRVTFAKSPKAQPKKIAVKTA